MKKALLPVGLLALGYMTFMGLSTAAYAQTEQIHDYQYYFDLYGVEVVNNPGVDTTFPTWAKPNPDQNITDLSYWVNDVLPYAQDRNAEKYIVYPKFGVVVPVLTPNATDQALIDQGEMFNHFPYLEQGALHYFGYDAHQGFGNMVIAGHSSYNKNAAGRYKTTFQVLPISKPGEKIFVYLKNDKGTFDFYEYTITDSFRTDRFNVSIMEHTPNEYTLTTYGCYIIGSNEERWVNKATMTAKQLDQSDLSRTHASAGDEDPVVSLISDKALTIAAVPATNIITQQILARTISNAYDSINNKLPDGLRVSIAQLISARLSTQARDAQEATSSTTTTQEHSSADEVVSEPTIVQSAAEIIASLLRPKISFIQEIAINRRARQMLSSRSPEQITEFIQLLQAKQEELADSTDKVSLRKDVVITYLLTQLKGGNN